MVLILGKAGGEAPAERAPDSGKKQGCEPCGYLIQICPSPGKHPWLSSHHVATWTSHTVHTHGHSGPTCKPLGFLIQLPRPNDQNKMGTSTLNVARKWLEEDGQITALVNRSGPGAQHHPSPHHYERGPTSRKATTPALRGRSLTCLSNTLFPFSLAPTVWLQKLFWQQILS